MKLIDSLDFPRDIKKLSQKDIEILSNELREFLIESVSKTGGHLSSNLGVVDLTLSLFRAFNFEKDKNWRAVKEKRVFPNESVKSFQDYFLSSIL